MAHKRFLLLIDFLGFSDFVLKEPLEHVLTWYEKVIVKSMSWLDKRNIRQSDNCILKWNYLSDSLFLWIDDCDLQKQAFLLLVYYANQMIYDFPGYNKDMPFAPARGALVYDSFEISEKEITRKYRTDTLQLTTGKITHTEDYSLSKEIYTIVGRAVVNASKWEKNQNWLGVSIAPYCVNEIERNYSNELELLLKYRLLHEHEVPTKDNSSKTYAFNGVPPLKDVFGELKEALALLQESERKCCIITRWFMRACQCLFTNTLPQVIEQLQMKDKYKNTLDYVRWIKENELHLLPCVEFPL
ncbi:MAG: hypothetical protein KKA99_01500 [Gammaproteobacteria bacterium]|nr:hypothetical protein [Gammaproteobacteria bacterium]MBU1615881.1 hypothetical protein [bacterium]